MPKRDDECECENKDDGGLGCAAVILALCLGISACSVSEHYVKYLDAKTESIQKAK